MQSPNESASTDNEPQLVFEGNQYYIERGRSRIKIRPSQRYGEADLVVYAMSVVEVTNVSGEAFDLEAFSHVDFEK